jgi:stress response protein SCP2
MANYKIKKYNGTYAPIPELVEHADTIDNSTSLSFFSKGYDYGVAVNTNMLRLMEHFCSFSKPKNPVMGQLWFDSINKSLSVYNGKTWDSVKFGTITPKSLQWSGNLTQNTIGTESTISGTITVTDYHYNCIFKPDLFANSNQALSDYIISGNIPIGLTVNVTANSLFNSAYITITGTIPSSTPSFNFKIEFNASAFTNVMDISEVANISNTAVIPMTFTPPTTTSTTLAPTTTTTTEATTTTTTSQITTTTTAAGTVPLSTFSSIKLGITWGGGVDLDTVVAAYDATGKCTDMSTVTHAGSIPGVTYGGDIRTGGTEEYYNIDLTQLTCSKLVLGILEYTDNSFTIMSSLNTNIVDNTTHTNIASFTLSTIAKDASNTPNTTCIVGVFTKSGTTWSFASYQKLINSHNGKHAIWPNDLYSSLGL